MVWTILEARMSGFRIAKPSKKRMYDLRPFSKTVYSMVAWYCLICAKTLANLESI